MAKQRLTKLFISRMKKKFFEYESGTTQIPLPTSNDPQFYNPLKFYCHIPLVLCTYSPSRALISHLGWPL
jgi:hypothetical protein